MSGTNNCFVCYYSGAAPPHPGSGASAAGGGGAAAAGGAASRDDNDTPVNEKSFDSEMADEGLDLSHFSQTREMSMFTGPYLNVSEEEVVLGTVSRLW